MRSSHIPRGMYQLLLVVSLTGGCSEDPGSSSSENPSVEPPVISFEDATLDSGLEFATVSGAQPSTQILEVKGGGLALIDFDSDGDRDLLVPDPRAALRSLQQTAQDDGPHAVLEPALH